MNVLPVVMCIRCRYHYPPSLMVVTRIGDDIRKPAYRCANTGKCDHNIERRRRDREAARG